MSAQGFELAPARAPVIAHRGASGDAPENTVAAILRAADDGARAVEIDVNTSADGVCFVHHDERLDRCTDASGPLHEKPADELDRVFASAGMDGFEREPLPRLAAVLDAVLARDLVLNLEIKSPAGRERIVAEAISDALSAHPVARPASSDAPGRLILSSFSEVALEVVRARRPELPRALLTGPLTDDTAAAMARTGCTNVHCSAAGFDGAVASRLADGGHRVYCYTVNALEVAQRLLDDGAAGVFTDHPRRLLSGLRLQHPA